MASIHSAAVVGRGEIVHHTDPEAVLHMERRAVTAVGEGVATGVRSGKVYVLRGSTSNLIAQVALDQSTLQTNDDLDGFGQRLGVGDWNNDGKLDIAITAPGFPSGAATNPLYLFKGATSGPIAWQSLTVP